MPQSLTCHIPDFASLDAFTQVLASVISAGDVLALTGPMGAGKTAFTQSLGKALGVKEKIVSPTFVLIHEYMSGKLPVVHVDLYRLGSEQSESLADDLLPLIHDKTALVVVEWADYGDYLQPETTCKLTFEIQPDDSRKVMVQTENLSVAKALQPFILVSRS